MAVRKRPTTSPTSPNQLKKEVPRAKGGPLRVAGLFAGIGGIEKGLDSAGHETVFLCENDVAAKAVLNARYPGRPYHDDVRTLASLPREVDLVTAGFPCQDLSQAGKTAGIGGMRSGLVSEVFRLLAARRVEWLLLENVPFMLQLAKGRALEVILGALEELNYKWAYRVVTAQSFGIPQRRERVFLLASQQHDPRPVLFSDDVGDPPLAVWRRGHAFGFYWTEGIRGLGAAVDAVPTLKGGSTIGIPSPPAIVLPDGMVGTPDIRDAERLQAFEADWTQPSELVVKRGMRWKLVGNAVCAKVSAWIGRRLREPGAYDGSRDPELRRPSPWPRAAWNLGDGRRTATVSAWPESHKAIPITDFLRYPVSPLSVKATAGFLSRAKVSTLRFPDGFLATLEKHLQRQIRSQEGPLPSRRSLSA